MIIELLARFWAKVDKRGPDECWPWTGACTEKGYGQIAIGDSGKTALATHVALAAAGRGRPWPGAIAMHKCDNPPCVNEAHLTWATQGDNVRDSHSKGRQGPRARKASATPRGSNHGNAKLDEAKVRYIRTSSATSIALGLELGVTSTCVLNVRNRTTWRHIL